MYNKSLAAANARQKYDQLIAYMKNTHIYVSGTKLLCYLKGSNKDHASPHLSFT